MDKKTVVTLTITVDADDPKSGNIHLSRPGHPGSSYPFGPLDEVTHLQALKDAAQELYQISKP